MHRTFNQVARVFLALLTKREGNVALLFGLAAIPVVIGAGIAMDTARAYMVKTRLGAALDAAALAVGSQSNQSSATLTANLQNYFYNNYCRKVPGGSSITSCTSTVANEGSISVQATSDITAATVTYQATATVPTTFMQLVGVNNLTVSVTSQTTKFPGMEVAVVLDNTGSMLCNGSATSSSGYSNCGPTTSTTDCVTQGASPSRICTLIAAAKQFVSTLQAAITGPQSIYISIVPYSTMVNVGNAFCSGGGCSNIATDSVSGLYTDQRGYIVPVVQVAGTTTRSSTSVSSVSMVTPSATVSGVAAVRAGMKVYGQGIPSGTTVSSASGTGITLSASATQAITGNMIAVGPDAAAGTSAAIAVSSPVQFNVTGSWTNNSTTVTVASTTGIATGMFVTSGSLGIPSGATVSAVGSGTITLSSKATASQTNKTLTITPFQASTTNGSASVTLTGNSAAMSSIVLGWLVSDSASSIPANTYVKNVSGTTLTLSNNATATGSGDILTFKNQGGTTTTGSTTISNVSFSSTPATGTVIIGNGIPVNTTITAASGSFNTGAGTLTISNAATKPTNFSSSTNTNFNTALSYFSPISYDSTYNSANPPGSTTNTNWAGCVIEPTGSSENVSNLGVINALGNYDVVEPVSGTKFYPFYWVRDSANAWSGNNTAALQDKTTEIQGNISSFDTLDGPNQGCTAPILPLTDLTTSAGQTAINNAINNMWPKNAGGTQVHVGMIWGWRVLAPNGPFASNNGHPLDYATASSRGWKKIIVLMTDGSEEWVNTTEYTGLGGLADGKIGTNSSTTTAVSNLNTRLSTICANLQASSGNYIIYTVALGTDGQNNSILQNNCPANGGFSSNATTSDLTAVFNRIANSIIHLRLTM
jgi:Flp pilus assembly protein TadG